MTTSSRAFQSPLADWKKNEYIVFNIDYRLDLNYYLSSVVKTSLRDIQIVAKIVAIKDTKMENTDTSSVYNNPSATFKIMSIYKWNNEYNPTKLSELTSQQVLSNILFEELSTNKPPIVNIYYIKNNDSYIIIGKNNEGEDDNKKVFSVSIVKEHSAAYPLPPLPPLIRNTNKTATTSVVSQGGSRSYDNLTVKELQARCIKRKIPYSGKRKAELISALRKK